MAITSDQGIIEMVNSALAKWLGYNSEDLIGENIKIMIPEEVRPHHDSYIHGEIVAGVTSLHLEARNPAPVFMEGEVHAGYLHGNASRMVGRALKTHAVSRSGEHIPVIVRVTEVTFSLVFSPFPFLLKHELSFPKSMCWDPRVGCMGRSFSQHFWKIRGSTSGWRRWP